MESKKLPEKNEMTSLNDDLFSEFMVRELEERLETNPLFFNDPTDVDIVASSCFTCHLCFSCGEF